MDNWLILSNEKKRAGFMKLRVAAEIEAFFDYAKSVELLRYEVALGRQLNQDLYGLCLYKIHRPDEKEFIQLKKCHSHIIFKDKAARSNLEV